MKTIMMIGLLMGGPTPEPGLDLASQQFWQRQRELIGETPKSAGLSKLQSLEEMSEQKVSESILREFQMRPRQIPKRAVPDSNCMAPIGLGEGYAAHFDLSEGGEVWFKMNQNIDENQVLKLSTLGSNADTILEMFDTCGGEPVSTADDNIGIAAEIAFTNSDQPRRLKLTASSDGSVIAKASVTPGLRGKISDELTGVGMAVPVQFLEVRNSSWLSYAGTTSSRVDGSFTFALDVGSYVVQVNDGWESLQTHVAMQYPDTDCITTCPVDLESAGEQQYVTSSEVRALDVALPRAGRVSGTVSRRARIYLGGHLIADGTAYDQRVPFGDYHVYAEPVYNNSTGQWITTLAPDIACSSQGCSDEMATADPVAVTAANPVVDVPIAIQQAANVTGSVVDNDGNAVGSMIVSAYDLAGRPLRHTYVGSNGDFSMYLAAGDYYLMASESQYEYYWKPYGGTDCIPSVCDATRGAIVSVSNDTPPLDFVVTQGHEVTVKLVDEDGIAADGMVCLSDAPFSHPCTTTTNGQAQFRRAPGAYVLSATDPSYGTARFLDETYDGQTCWGEWPQPCRNAELATLVEVTTEPSVIDFRVFNLPELRVRVTDAVTGSLVPKAYAYGFAESNDVLLRRFTYEARDYSFIVHAEGYGDVTASASITEPGEIYDMNVALPLAGIVEVDTTANADSLEICAWNGSYTRCQSYVTELELGPGIYAVGAAFNYQAYILTPSGQFPCNSTYLRGCVDDHARNVNVFSNQRTTLRFSVPASEHHNISGNVDCGQCYVELYRDGTMIDSRWTRSGFFELSASPGRYKIISPPIGNYLGDAWGTDGCSGQQNCLDRALEFSPPLHGISLRHSQVAALLGTVTDPSGDPISGILIDIWTENGLLVDTVSTHEDGSYFWLTDEATVGYVSTAGGDESLLHMVWPDVECPLGSAFGDDCELSAGQLRRTYGDRHDLNRADFVLRNNDVFAAGFEVKQ